MTTRRRLMTASLAAPAAAAMPARAAGLTLRALPAGPTGFFRAPVLISGATEAVLVDGGFTLSDGRAMVEAVRASGRRLTTIYVSQSDPDYYFGLRPLRDAFPEARILAAPETIAAIQGNVEKKLATWGPQLRENGPASLADVVIPAPFTGRALQVDGAAIEIVAAEGMGNRRYLWVPELRAVVGGVLVFAGVHVWTADTQTPALRAAWRANLERIAARGPAVVVPGHMTPAAAMDVSAVAHTLAYLTAFEEELAKAANGAALNAAMKARFLGLGMEVAIDIGARVATGEMPWG
ncbi:MBL fold metallo-hydrolase [Falsiroseomonas sp.]|uniref:MBL fold metallo-hydrolase n=1 Tax=Falsiroseomonas sp. TaxID=2870721 RepID=UPI003F6EF015